MAKKKQVYYQKEACREYVMALPTVWNDDHFRYDIVSLDSPHTTPYDERRIIVCEDKQYMLGLLNTFGEKQVLALLEKREKEAYLKKQRPRSVFCECLGWLVIMINLSGILFDINAYPEVNAYLLMLLSGFHVALAFLGFNLVREARLWRKVHPDDWP